MAAVLDFEEWIAPLLAPFGFDGYVGEWDEGTTDADKRYSAVMGGGGPAASAQVRRPRVQLVLLGKRGNPGGEVPNLLSAADALGEIVVNTRGPWPCGAANVQLVGELTGPGFTDENRPWVRLDFQLIF